MISVPHSIDFYSRELKITVRHLPKYEVSTFHSWWTFHFKFHHIYITSNQWVLSGFDFLFCVFKLVGCLVVFKCVQYFKANYINAMRFAVMKRAVWHNYDVNKLPTCTVGWDFWAHTSAQWSWVWRHHLFDKVFYVIQPVILYSFYLYFIMLLKASRKFSTYIKALEVKWMIFKFCTATSLQGPKSTDCPPIFPTYIKKRFSVFYVIYTRACILARVQNTSAVDRVESGKSESVAEPKILSCSCVPASTGSVASLYMH